MQTTQKQTDVKERQTTDLIMSFKKADLPLTIKHFSTMVFATVSTHLDAGSLRYRNFPSTVQIVGVRFWVSRREDRAFAVS